MQKSLSYHIATWTHTHNNILTDQYNGFVTLKDFELPDDGFDWRAETCWSDWSVINLCILLVYFCLHYWKMHGPKNKTKIFIFVNPQFLCIFYSPPSSFGTDPQICRYIRSLIFRNLKAFFSLTFCLSSINYLAADCLTILLLKY